MEKNQSEQQFYLSSLGSPSIISSAQFPCTVIGSSKNAIHTIVPNNSNSSITLNAKYQNTSNDFKIAQNQPSSNIHNCFANITNPNEEIKYLLSNSSKNKKQHNKRSLNTKVPSQCMNSNDNSSDITAAPNQLTILVQKVLPAQVPDNLILTTSSIPPHINTTHFSIKAHSSSIISNTQMNEKSDLLMKKELSVDSKKDISIFSPISKDSESILSTAPTNSGNPNIESRDTISEVIKEVLIKALSNDPHEDVFLSVIKSRENVSRPYLESTEMLDISSSISSPILSHTSDNPHNIQLSIQNSIPFQRHSDQLVQRCTSSNKSIPTTNFLHPQLLNPADIKPLTNDVMKSNQLAQSFPVKSSDFFPTSNCQINNSNNISTNIINCSTGNNNMGVVNSNISNSSGNNNNININSMNINQKLNLTEESIAHAMNSVTETGSKTNKRRNSSTSKVTAKKQKLSESIFNDKQNIPMQRCQQNMVKLLGTPNFRKLVHEPRIKNNLTVLSPLGCKLRSILCADIHQLQDNCVKYKRSPFSIPQINPMHLKINNSINNRNSGGGNGNSGNGGSNGTSYSQNHGPGHGGINTNTNSNNHIDRITSENSFILQNINASIPEGMLLSTHESDDIECLIAASPSNNELDYLSVFNCDPISSPSVNLSGPNLEMLHPPNRTQSPQLSVFHCPNKDYLKFDHPDLNNSSRKPDINNQSLLRATGISRVQISHKYSSTPMTEPSIPDNALIDSETGEIVSKPASSTDQSRSSKPPPATREKLLVTFTINPPDDVEKIVRNITDVLGIDYSSVEFKETTRGGEIAIDKESMSSNSIPKEICERYNTSVVVNNSSCKLESNNSCLGNSNSINNNSNINKSFENTISIDKTEFPIYSEKVYKSTALLNKPPTKCSNCDKPIIDQKIINTNSNNLLSDRLKCRDLNFCDENCQQEYSTADDDNHSSINNNTNNSNYSNKLSESRDQCIFIGDELSEASVIVQGSISKSKQISKRLGALINDKLLKKKSALANSVPPLKLPLLKLHKGSKYHTFHHSSLAQDPMTSSIISDSHFNKLSIKSKSVLRRLNQVDRRCCALCERLGDMSENGPGRLLCFDVDKWLHINCALWCNNVFEMQCGALNNVSESFIASMKSICNGCGKPGAGIACYYPRCTLKYHVPCAQEKGCLFYADRAMYCQLHQSKDVGPHLMSLNVDRRVYISRDELSQVAGTINNEDQHFFLRIGSLIVISIGQLLPHQIHSGNFHNLNHVYPTGFKSRRIHWSTRVVNSRSVYECEILIGNDNMPLFKVTATDENMENECYFGSTCFDAWKTIMEKISNLRKSSKVVKIFPEHIKAEDLYGLTEPHVLRAIESLPGLESLSDYAFKFGKMQLIVEMPLPINMSGSMRTEPFVKLYRHAHKPSIHQHPNFVRQQYLLATKPDSCLYNNKTTLSSKWQQYRKLKSETKFNVVLKRSKIQGFGLYAAKDLEKGTMIIEYVGQLIRNEVANIREKKYESKKQGIYMFRLDPMTVIDATRAGDLARYINHCCDPNCVTEHLEFEKESHIVIISSRKIEKGEELTYDYKFDLDDGKDDKIPCLCGARNCKRWMN